MDLLYGTENSKTSPEFLVLIAKIRHARSLEIVNLGSFLATFVIIRIFLDLNMLRKRNLCNDMETCMYVLYLQLSCMAESKTVPEILKFTSFVV